MNGILTKLALISLRKNKVRTFSTTIGIVLAVTLMTVVVILATSISASMIAGATEKYGAWHIMSEDITQSQFENMRTDGMIESVCFVRNYCYAQIDSPVDSSKPYIHIADVSQTFPDFLSCELLNGRMPQNSGEIAVTSRYLQDYPAVDLNSVIELNAGERISNDTGETLWQNASYLGIDKEHIEISGEKISFTIVGIIEDSVLEYKFSPGYSFITCGIQNIAKNTKVYIKLNNLSSNISKLGNYLSEDKIIYNTELLNYLGVSDGENLQGILTTIVVCLIVIIGMAAFVLIHNSLMMSSDERSKQFGILFSVGMTRSQTLLMYLIETLINGIISIAVGLAVGILFAFLSFQTIGSFIAKTSYLTLSLTVSIDVPYLLVIVLISFTILFIAALLNANGQYKGTVISKLRKNSDIKQHNVNRCKSQKTSCVSVEWNIVWNSFKRYNKKYRYVIISLSLSAVLFVASGLFGNYADNYIKEIMPTAAYDIMVISRENALSETVDTQYNSLSALDEVNDGGWLCTMDAGYISFDGLNIDDSYNFYAQNKNITTMAISYIIVSDESVSTLSGATANEVYFYDQISYYFDEEEYHSNLLQDSVAEVTLYSMNDEQRSLYYQTGLLEENSTPKRIALCRAENRNLPIELEAIANSNGFFLIIPIGRISEFTDEIPIGLQMYFSAANHSAAVQKIKQIGEENGWNLSVTDVADSFEKEKSTYAMYEIFAMIFTLLISLVAVINAVNTISSNLIKRKRDFAVLQSIGLSNRSFYKIIFYECLILCGIVFAVTLFFTPAISAILSFSFPITNYVFIFPWLRLIITASCLLAVFALSMIKPIIIIKKQNIIETIKGDTD